MRRLFALALSLSLLAACSNGCGSTPHKPTRGSAIASAEGVCFAQLLGALAEKEQAAQEAGKTQSAGDIAIELAPSTLLCVLGALGAKPAAAEGSGSSAGSGV